MTTDAPPSRRVLLLAGCFADAVAAIDLAVAAAARMGAGIEGVLALDPRAEAAALATVGPRGRAGPVPSHDQLQRACAADARAFRRRLDLVAARASLRWRLSIETGLLPDLAMGLRRPGDAVILGHRRFLALRGPVVALGGRATGETAQLAADLARALRLRPRLLPADTPLSEIELLAASAIVLPPTLPQEVPQLTLLIDAARCPLLLRASG